MTQHALQDIKVADFSWAIAGPLVSEYLAHHGATVVRVESFTNPDVVRTWGPFKDGVVGLNRSSSFPTYNTSKYSLSVNLKHPHSSKVIKKLLTWADILLENFTVGTMKKFGFAYEEVAKINPNIIYASITMQGQTGPHCRHPGVGPNAASLAGLTQLCGWPDRIPSNIYGAYSDFIAPYYAGSAILAALDYRHETGKGQYLDISMYETSIQFLAPLVLDYTVNGRETMTMGNRCPYTAPHGVFPCKGTERWCAIAVFTDEEWNRLREVMGDPVWARNSKFTTLLCRKEHEDELEKLISEWTASLTVEELVNKLRGAGVAAAVVETVGDIDKDPQLKYRRHFKGLEHDELGVIGVDSPAFNLSKTPPELRPAPTVGQHNDYVCTQLLSMTDEEFIALLTEGVFD